MWLSYKQDLSQLSWDLLTAACSWWPCWEATGGISYWKQRRRLLSEITAAFEAISSNLKDDHVIWAACKARWESPRAVEMVLWRNKTRQWVGKHICFCLLSLLSRTLWLVGLHLVSKTLPGYLCQGTPYFHDDDPSHFHFDGHSWPLTDCLLYSGLYRAARHTGHSTYSFGPQEEYLDHMLPTHLEASEHAVCTWKRLLLAIVYVSMLAAREWGQGFLCLGNL